MLFGIFAHTPGTLVGVAVVLIVFCGGVCPRWQTLSEPVENGNPHCSGRPLPFLQKGTYDARLAICPSSRRHCGRLHQRLSHRAQSAEAVEPST